MKYKNVSDSLARTSNFWPDLVSPGINTDNHSQTRSQQEQEAQWGQGEEPEGQQNTWRQYIPLMLPQE